MEQQSMKGLKIPHLATLPISDKLKEMLVLQAEINKAFVPSVKDMNSKQREEWTARLIFALQNETAELADLINWKWWKKQKKDIDLLEVKFEAVDMLHFLLSIMLIWGMDSNEIYRMYVAKARENLDRQKRKY